MNGSGKRMASVPFTSNDCSTEHYMVNIRAHLAVWRRFMLVPCQIRQRGRSSRLHKRKLSTNPLYIYTETVVQPRSQATLFMI